MEGWEYSHAETIMMLVLQKQWRSILVTHYLTSSVLIKVYGSYNSARPCLSNNLEFQSPLHSCVFYILYIYTPITEIPLFFVIINKVTNNFLSRSMSRHNDKYPRSIFAAQVSHENDVRLSVKTWLIVLYPTNKFIEIFHIDLPRGHSFFLFSKKRKRR